MKQIVAYTDCVKDMKWDDFNFNSIEIKTLPPLEDPEYYKNSFTFKDALLEAVHDFSGHKILKLILVSPDIKVSTKFYVFAYLEGKNILTLEIKNTPIFNTWFNNIDGKKKEEQVTSKVYSFGSNQFSCQPTTNFKEDYIYKNTGDFISKFIPNAFIAEELAKEKVDFLAPFIQLEAKINLEDLKQSFKALVAEKGLTCMPPKNNDAIYTKFEKEAGFPFPSIVKAYLTIHNGCENTAFMGIENIYEEWKQWKDIYDDWTQEELLDTYTTNLNKALLMYTTPYWIPFFNLQNGNFLAFDFAPNTKGTSGQIIRYGADQEIGYIEADSIHTFIKSLMGNQGEIEDSEWYGERVIC
ncbi:SMI1/KNR4 family protein [Formosa sp. L2A11]|uniref:SMI1/KNR4 family protein n=1 Tax=Formosa sp. L2A11 TaxID=2686363 RepID=UPI00131B56F5|nr:SMI1/KNR4 family protein [Formosa sp. L2A11]